MFKMRKFYNSFKNKYASEFFVQYIILITIISTILIFIPTSINFFKEGIIFIVSIPSFVQLVLTGIIVKNNKGNKFAYSIWIFSVLFFIISLALLLKTLFVEKLFYMNDYAFSMGKYQFIFQFILVGYVFIYSKFHKLNYYNLVKKFFYAAGVFIISYFGIPIVGFIIIFIIYFNPVLIYLLNLIAKGELFIEDNEKS